MRRNSFGPHAVQSRCGVLAVAPGALGWINGQDINEESSARPSGGSVPPPRPWAARGRTGGLRAPQPRLRADRVGDPVAGDGMLLRQTAPGVTVADLIAATDAELTDAL